MLVLPIKKFIEKIIPLIEKVKFKNIVRNSIIKKPTYRLTDESVRQTKQIKETSHKK